MKQIDNTYLSGVSYKQNNQIPNVASVITVGQPLNDLELCLQGNEFGYILIMATHDTSLWLVFCFYHLCFSSNSRVSLACPIPIHSTPDISRSHITRDEGIISTSGVYYEREIAAPTGGEHFWRRDRTIEKKIWHQQLNRKEEMSTQRSGGPGSKYTDLCLSQGWTRLSVIWTHLHVAVLSCHCRRQ